MRPKKIDILNLKNVTKEYVTGKVVFRALDNVDFKIKQNDYTVIIGPSGGGKSTLLHILGLLDTPTSGKVFFYGKDVSEYTSDQLAEIRFNKIGFVFQSFYLVSTLSAIENVMLPMMFYDVPYTKRYKRAKLILDRLDLSDKLKNLPSELSGGEQQRVSVARSMVNNPELLLADEPTGNLDSKSGDKVLNKLKQIHNEGKTVVVITHDVNIAKKPYVNKIIYLKDGKIHKRL
jgi:ABC-type lipoprotein export system ATPase subunit